ncbi:tetratricopeptide repeat protein [Caenimonas koreensis]|uniref:tetratricopeptide repeat-containing glycosyltransferase family protein n=1 Tax=Caenimonas koreensis TaxID=367474 RepID=UPI00378438DC
MSAWTKLQGKSTTYSVTLVKHIIGGIQTPASTTRNPQESARWIAVGRAAANDGRHDQALACFKRAVEQDPDSAPAHFQLAREHYRRNNLPLAQAAFERAVALRPDYPQALNGLAVVMQLKGEWVTSEVLFRRAIEASPDFGAAMSSLGNTLFHLGRLAEAEQMFHSALGIDMNLREAHQGLGLLLHCEQRMDEAEQVCRGAVERWPNTADLRLNLGLLLLARDKYEEGWACYEARHASSMSAEVRRQALPGGTPWAGQALDGKSLHIVAEQGFGDMIQIVRYVPLLRRMGVSRLTLECAAPLRPLLQGMEGIDELVKAAPAQFDYWCYTMSVPRLMRTDISNIPATLPYLSAPAHRAEFAKALLGPRPAGVRRVGLVWKGMAANRHDAFRSLAALSSLSSLWSVPGVQFVSLQKGAGEEEAKSPPAGQALLDAGTSLRDFADTAAVIHELDLVITVDTAVAHLAAALGKPVWLLLARRGLDWRWGIGRNDSPWYPGVMRLFRQEQIGNWQGVIDEVRAALDALAAQGEAQPQ